jgi:hypothetical protein
MFNFKKIAEEKKAKKKVIISLILGFFIIDLSKA